MTYVPSGDVEAVLREIKARGAHRPHRLPLLAAGALPAVAPDGQGFAAGQVRPGAAAERNDTAAVNHEWDREAWLRRVQRCDR